MSIRESEDTLFSIWRTKRDRFVEDGVVNEASYLSASRQILLLMKEVNDPEGGGWDLRDHLRNGTYPHTWNNAARWAYGILNSCPSFSDVPEPDAQFRKRWIEPLAVVNVKKVGGGASANQSDIMEYARGDRELLRTQLGLYKPGVTVCCSTSRALRLLFDPVEIGPTRTTSNGTAYSKSATLGLVIHYYHPQVRYPANFLYTMLMEAVKEGQVEEREPLG